jgi:UDP-N-acetylglucosamine 2-epimerase (non-hydrolysing)
MSNKKTSPKVASVVGARPNFIKLAPIHSAIHDVVNHQIIHTGQHYDFELSSIFFKEFDLPEPNYNLNIGSGSPCFQIGEMIKNLEKLILQNKFDLILVYGDTNSTLAGALAGIKAGVKVAHVEAGLRSFDRRMPEEMNRILTDNMSNYLFVPTETAKQNLENENTSGMIYNTGDTSVEVIERAKIIAIDSKILSEHNLQSKNYIVFTMHRWENTQTDESLSSVIRAFEMLPDKIIVFPIHPRTKKILTDMNLYDRISRCKNVKIIPPLGYIDFIKLLQDADKIITDSGGIQKEAYLLSVPCITIRKNTEWTETVAEGWNILADTNTKQIVKYAKEWNPIRSQYKSIFGDGKTSLTIKSLISDLI